MSPLYFAFLRAINVGGHNVKMDHLRHLFQAEGFQGVESFIASGNIIFARLSSEVVNLERKIEAMLRASLGYDVAVFLRTDDEVVDIVNFHPFPLGELDTFKSLNVALISRPLLDSETQILMRLETAIDKFHVHGKEIFWYCRTKQSESTFSTLVLEKAIKMPATFRNINTFIALAEKYGLAKGYGSTL